MPTHGTDFVFNPAPRGRATADVLIVPLLLRPLPPMELVARVDKLCRGAVARLLAVKAAREDVGHLGHTAAEGTYPRVVVVSLGDAKKLRPVDVRQAGANAARWLMGEQLTRAALWLDGMAGVGVDRAEAEFVQGMALAGFRYSGFKKPERPAPTRIDVTLVATDQTLVAREQPHMKAALTVAQAANLARRLAHEPPNVLNPATFAAEARTLARGAKLKCTILEAAKLRQLKMNGLLTVGGGAKHPPCLIQLEYRGNPRAKATTVLVGKGITFDTGGYSLKPRDAMDGMKFDMCGGAVVMGVLKAAAALQLKCNVIGLVATAENSVSEAAYRPDDIIRMASGKTVEVTNTDAEGRLVLADALWYAQQQFQPAALIDIATLTGGVGIALGSAAAGIMGNSDELAAELAESGRRTHERLWRLPLWDDYKELMKSHEADLRNSSNKREAHAIQGGIFLKAFVDDKTPWAHLDIAAVVHSDNGRVATGFGVRLLTDYLQRRSGN